MNGIDRVPPSSPLSSKISTVSLLQFIGMELCGHGDAEGLIRNQPDGLLSLSEAHCFLFQMAFALYVGRTELSMRHFDVKLLNFLVADAAALLGGVSGSEGAAGTPAEPGDLSSLGDEQLLGMEDGGGVVLRYAVGAEVVELRMPEERAFVVSETKGARKSGSVVFVKERFWWLDVIRFRGFSGLGLCISIDNRAESFRIDRHARDTQNGV